MFLMIIRLHTKKLELGLLNQILVLPCIPRETRLGLQQRQAASTPSPAPTLYFIEMLSTQKRSITGIFHKQEILKGIQENIFDILFYSTWKFNSSPDSSFLLLSTPMWGYSGLTQPSFQSRLSFIYCSQFVIHIEKCLNPK